MQAAKQIDDRIKPLIHFKITDAFQTCPEFLISILRDIHGCELLLIHKLLEAIITRFLEHHLV